MKQFLLNWTYKKQLIAEILLYGSIAVVGNSFFGKGQSEGKKSIHPLTVYKQMGKGQKILNAAIGGCFLLDMSVGYLLLNSLKKKLS